MVFFFVVNVYVFVSNGYIAFELVFRIGYGFALLLYVLKHSDVQVTFLRGGRYKQVTFYEITDTFQLLVFVYLCYRVNYLFAFSKPP